MWLWYHNTPTSLSALDFHNVETTRLSCRLETRSLKNFSISKTDVCENLAWKERCWRKSYGALKKISSQKFREHSFPLLGTGKLKHP